MRNKLYICSLKIVKKSDQMVSENHIMKHLTSHRTWNALILLKSVRTDAMDCVSNITYNPRGQRENVYYGNNTKTRYYYHPLNFRLTRILTTRNNGQDILQDLNYSYDSVGNITGITDNAQQTFYFNNRVIAPTGSYQYDALYRLLQATGRELLSLGMPTHDDFPNNIPCPNPASNAMRNYTQHYQYDALGNMLQMQSAGNWTRNYEYNNPMNNNYLLGHGDGTVYSYDAHGNMLTMPHLSSMSYDYQDQLIRAGNGTFVSYYNYDAEGNRTRKVVVKNNIIETRYYINGYEVYRKEANGVVEVKRKTVNITDDEKVFVRIEQKTGETEVVRYQYDNHLGSACLELDDSGQIISYEEYHPFGTTSYRSGRTETEVSLKRYKYCGKERDEETGLYYYGMRYYAAWLCRFVSVDPLRFQYPELTPFQYASNRPVTMIDLDGKEGVKPDEKYYEGAYDQNGNLVGSSENPIVLKEVEIIAKKTEVEVKNTDNVLFSGNAKSSDVSQYTKELISQIASEIGMTLTITSTKRNIYSQINAMYTNIIKQGFDAQMKLYGTKGKDVIRAYQQAKQEGKTEKEIKSAMIQKAIDVGFVSTHMSPNYDKLNAIDFGYFQFKNTSQKNSFIDAVKNLNATLSEDLQIKMFIEKNCFHLDVPQKK